MSQLLQLSVRAWLQIYGLNALHVASKMGHAKFVEALLEKKASPNARARGSETQGWSTVLNHRCCVGIAALTVAYIGSVDRTRGYSIGSLLTRALL